MLKKRIPVCAVLCGALALASSAQAAVIFADDFDDADGTVLKSKAPDTGLSWEQTAGPDVVVSGGAMTTQGAARVIFGNFASALGAAEPLLTVTIEATFIGHNAGYGGLSLYQGDSERIFFGDLSDETTTWGLSVSGVGGGSSVGYSGPQTVTLSYDFSTGLTQLFDGASASGAPLLSQNAAPGIAFDRFRIANDGGGDIGMGSITIQTAIPEPGSAVLLAGGLALAGAARRRRK